ncbi:MAG TPA: flagellin, partial [Phycisphaerae bacterium]|nr:flagellin [Phycisphaerae bacterium]
MSRINTNVSSIIAQRILTTQNTRLNQSLQRLSTGLRINSGKDDPAGLIASETLRAEKNA